MSKKNDKYIQKQGFTLAEVLITLVVIGVIAAITIPVLMANYQEEAAKSKLKKNYAAFKNAFELIKTVDGDDYRDLELENGKIKITKQIFDNLSKHMSIQTVCEHNEECFPSQGYEKSGKIDGNNYESKSGSDEKENFAFVLNDGTSVLFTIWKNTTVTSQQVGVNNSRLNIWNLAIFVDLNGDRAPNTNGKDVFYFILTKDGLVPGGIDNESIYCNDRNKYNTDCAAKMLRK